MKSPRRNLITVDGVTRSISEWSRITGLGRVTIWKRLSRGMSPRDAVTMPLQRRRRLTANGQTLTVPAWAKRLGTSTSVIHNRLASGWTEADACLLPVQQGHYERRRAPG